jgi:hypothetical protein
MLRRIWQQRNLARALYRERDAALVLCAGADLPARFELPTVGHVTAEHRDILVIGVLDLVDAEGAATAPGAETPAATTAALLAVAPPIASVAATVTAEVAPFRRGSQHLFSRHVCLISLLVLFAPLKRQVVRFDIPVAIRADRHTGVELTPAPGATTRPTEEAHRLRDHLGHVVLLTVLSVP